jgi:hypothetical protein
MFMNDWNSIVDYYQNDPNVQTRGINCEMPENKQLIQQFKVNGFPTVLIVKGDKVIPYNGTRSASAIIRFVDSI